MKATELRIGNHVYNNYEKFITIRGLISNECFSDISGYSYEEIEPIPLTEEWLLKFGWIWNNECNSYEKYPNGDARMNLSYRSINNSYTMFNYVLKAIIAERIWYVHQLQNLYFALTSQELTINN